MKIPSVMGHTFSQVPKAEIQRSQFDRSFGYKTTFDAGYLVPVMVDEVLPGDTFQVNMVAFARLATPIKPVMDNMFMDSFFFFVPLRLVWTNFVRFMGEQDDPGDSVDYLIPITVSGGYDEGTVEDYFGIPTHVPVTHSALWTRAYKLIWNEWFRDQNLQDSVVISKGDGPDGAAQTAPLRRGKRHDYFTSCLPFVQKGTAVSVPLGTSARVATDSPLADTDYLSVWSTAGTDQYRRLSTDPAVAEFLRASSVGGLQANSLYADLSTATSATINELRQAFQVQRLLERDARGGTRYTEKVRALFGVTSPDARFQRPEYLGGGTSMVTISPVAQTTASPASPTGLDAQGNLAGIGTLSATSGHGFVKSFTEHGLIIGMISVRADLTYQQGLDRMWSRRTRNDFFVPSLAHLGEQAVLRKEIFMDGTEANGENVFGYQERFAEYRYKPSKITGLFRSVAAGSLDVWHLSQVLDLASPGASEPPPTLSAAFIVEDPPIDRVIAVPSEPHFLFDSRFQMKCARPLPMFGVPGMIDHF